jgi:hypothetical protein
MSKGITTDLGEAMRTLALVIVLFALGGCATQAQSEYERMGQAAAKAKANGQACLRQLTASAEYQEVGPLLPPFDGTLPSIELRNNRSVPSPDQSQTLMRLYNGHIRPCRDAATADISAVHPAYASVNTEVNAVWDEGYAKLTNREVTWGAFAAFDAALTAEQRKRISEASQRIVGNLQTQHAGEIQQRQAAAAAFQQFAYQQQVILQNQQMINAMNQPRMTNCQYVGTYLNCTTF